MLWTSDYYTTLVEESKSKLYSNLSFYSQIIVLTICHKRSLLQQNADHHRKLQLNTDINRLWGAQLQWIHLYHSSYFYGSEDIVEEGLERLKDPEYQEPAVKQSLPEIAA